MFGDYQTARLMQAISGYPTDLKGNFLGIPQGLSPEYAARQAGARRITAELARSTDLAQLRDYLRVIFQGSSMALALMIPGRSQTAEPRGERQAFRAGHLGWAPGT
ncbi:hypothetical protein [Phytopseudomonas dryadis]|uniref:hypothetical protein n=1 Tax=Phytopseudomonas dryadis TaxID=2487520 RepID=UPI001038378C|nr:hypothetical protein [Pseudomonas dryadis]